MNFQIVQPADFFQGGGQVFMSLINEKTAGVLLVWQQPGFYVPG